MADQLEYIVREDVEIKDVKFSYKPKKVYNFEVSNWHTYFVGALAWIVHNAKKCLSGIVKKVSNRLKYMGRTPGKNSKTGKAVFERMRKEESCFPAGGTNFFVFRFSICGNRSKKYFFFSVSIWNCS